MASRGKQTTSSERQQCCGKWRGSGRWGWIHPGRCKRWASVEREGAHYCGTHDPVKVKARGEESVARWRAQNEAESEARKVKAERERLTEMLVAGASGDMSRANLRDLAKLIIGTT